MSDSQEKSDDLIAELAKLMASNAQGGDTEAKPTLKMPPLSADVPASKPGAPVAAAPQSARAPTPPPIRIPGMSQPVPQPAPPTPSAASQPAPVADAPRPAPTIRIPGMSQPVPVSPAPVAPQPVAASVEARPMPVDFTNPPGVDPVVLPASLEAAPEPVLTVPLRAAPSEPRRDQGAPMVAVPRVEPRFVPQPAASGSPERPANAPAGDSFDFDFGFGAEPPMRAETTPVVTPTRVEPMLNAGPVAQPEARPEPRSEPRLEVPSEPAQDRVTQERVSQERMTQEPIGREPVAPVAPVPVAHDLAAYDPIADLIAAELDDAEEAAPEPVQPQARPTAPPPFVAPARPPQPALAPMVSAPAPMLSAPPPRSGPEASVPLPRSAAPRPAPAPQQKTMAGADRFAVAPVFGLGRPAAPAPRREPDPMDEIESLIGEAVRVDLDPPQRPAVQPAPSPAPVVPPLTTGFAPRRSELKDREPPMQTAEDAILAAAATTGTRVDAIADRGRPGKRMKVKPPKSTSSGGSRQYLGMAVAGTLLLAAGLGLYWVLGMGRPDAGIAPVLTADTQPAKQPAPITPVSETETAAATGLFDQMQGTVPVDPDETLVPRDETAGATPTEIAAITPVTDGETEGGLANRKVRTVTVRPDGTIVSGDEAVAGNAVLPVDRPTVPEIAGASIEPSELLAATPGEPGALDPDAIAAAISGESTVTAEIDPNLSALVPNTVTATPLPVDPSVVAPTPLPRPGDRTAMVGGSNALSAAPVVEATEVSASSGSIAAAYVQLSSQRSEDEAQTSLRQAQSRFGNLLQGNVLEIQRADLGQKGVYYRVRLPSGSLQEATSICASIKANGGDCFATGS